MIQRNRCQLPSSASAAAVSAAIAGPTAAASSTRRSRNEQPIAHAMTSHRHVQVASVTHHLRPPARLCRGACERRWARAPDWGAETQQRRPDRADLSRAAMMPACAPPLVHHVAGRSASALSPSSRPRATAMPAPRGWLHRTTPRVKDCPGENQCGPRVERMPHAMEMRDRALAAMQFGRHETGRRDRRALGTDRRRQAGQQEKTTRVTESDIHWQAITCAHFPFSHALLTLHMTRMNPTKKYRQARLTTTMRWYAVPN